MSPETYLLHDMAEVISFIDHDKNHGGREIEEAIANARRIIGKMKMELIDIGNLPYLIDTIEISADEGLNQLQEAIVLTHAEITRLAGADAHQSYDSEVAA